MGESLSQALCRRLALQKSTIHVEIAVALAGYFIARRFGAGGDESPA
jgi:hypothetical protein